ncbi:GNAT family N-acetyltransferase [Brevibacillus laterosporus]|uniref:GNAT family N-acetyltransferase n=1 Tax=Brevibacillus laterosporus TaxID=1465 RepID=UPI002653DE79|nr:GNAT family N-acetyltransferase [Brevibacillus laterosporus]MDN9011508.1 GNAT family N-acetyltransferase [Brevibacillus laterosporus]MDO0942859.1 GNAT family N-acetyltransferase [Brevibacillus laterosporus]
MSEEVTVVLVPMEERDKGEYDRLLLEANESEEMIARYKHRGDMYAAYTEERLLGIAILLPCTEEMVEIKNIAVCRGEQGKGYGKQFISCLEEKAKEANYKVMVVGTANSSLDNLAFYQKVGFRITGIKADFFLQYPYPIWENGIRALDMVILKKNL